MKRIEINEQEREVLQTVADCLSESERQKLGLRKTIVIREGEFKETEDGDYFRAAAARHQSRADKLVDGPEKDANLAAAKAHTKASLACDRAAECSRLAGAFE
ncbi:MAG: hypothetical protein WBF15_19440 [Candidatus Sulfotelmatobacter sp.]